jgi:hypothetical protein
VTRGGARQTLTATLAEGGRGLRVSSGDGGDFAFDMPNFDVQVPEPPEPPAPPHAPHVQVMPHAWAWRNGDFGDRDAGLVASAGYAWAFTTRPGANDARTDRYRMYRMVVRDDAPAWEAVVRASGMPGRLQGLLPRRLWSTLQVR